MRQALLAGRCQGLRPSQRRRLDQLCHRRHPADAVADPLTLQRLAAEAAELDLPLTLVVDGRGLCRLLWLGRLEHPGELLERLPGSRRRQGNDLRLLTCSGGPRQPQLNPGKDEAIVALDLGAVLWLRFARQAGAGGQWPAALLLPAARGASPWRTLAEDDLSSLCGRDPLECAAATDGEAAPSTPTAPGRERVLLLSLSGADRGEQTRRIRELEGLVRSAGAEPVGVVDQRRSSQATALWGEGKLREAALEARRLRATLVVTDRELTPAQARGLESLLDLPVTDRSELILDIFAQRAASAAGRLQVELAQLRYRLPRLVGRGLSLSRQGGGIGTRGPGETQLEKDRRAIARRIERLQREVRRLGEHRERLRQGRRAGPRVALVGYTNAGKSSLLNALTRARGEAAVLAADRLFATLDPTTRRLGLSDGEGRGLPPLLLTDTVGFIRDLPPQLVEAFRSTIEEALAADGLLLVVDLSDPAWPEQLRTVRAILASLGSAVPERVVGNQIDRCPAEALERARALEPEMLFISATADLGLTTLRALLRTWPPRHSGGSDGQAVPTSEG